MQDGDDSAWGVAGPVAGGAAVLGGAAAVGYTAGALNEAGLFDVSGATLSEPDMLASTTTTSTTTQVMSEPAASRFLLQATNGPRRQDINYLCSTGISNWLVQQFSMPRGKTHWSYVTSLDPYYESKKGSGSNRMWDWSIWRQLVAAPDQLRQRMALALLDILVVGIDGLSHRYPQFAMAAYMDLLMDNVFGNFRTLLGAITTNSAMAQFLTFLSSSKAVPGRTNPDENYARELMQLFTLGLYQLNMDGTLRRDALGRPIETYTQDDVSQLARVFTGLRLQASTAYNPAAHRKPLVIDPRWNETGASTFLGKTVSGGGMTAINAALDVIFHHRNMAPFFARALIQRLVTSNPSAAYIRRVAERFANNGQGVRGDMKAVIVAVLTDTEARSDGAIGAPHTGRLRDTTQRLTGWARAFEATSVSGNWAFGDMSPLLLHSPGRSPSVFNFFRPGYAPPNSELQRRGLVAPELQIADEQSVLAWVNYIYVLIRAGRADIKSEYLPLKRIALNSAALIDEVSLLLCARQLTAHTRSVMIGALNSINYGDTETRRLRVWVAVMLVMTAPEYLVLQ